MEDIIVISIIAWYVSVGLNWVWFPKKILRKKRFRPFDCPKCMGFWLGLSYTWIEYDFKQAIVWAILCSFLAIVIEKGMNRL